MDRLPVIAKRVELAKRSTPIMTPEEQNRRKQQRERLHPRDPPEYVIGNGRTFRTGQLLGVGGFAKVYDAAALQDVQPGRLYALKVVRERFEQKKLQEKFDSELQIHERMHHPYIVRFYEHFGFCDNHYVVLEHCSNGSLMEMVRHRKALTEPEVRLFSIQMAGAIKYMHQRNVIHRDLKMGNILLDHHMNIKVADFGLAALLMEKEERKMTCCGTPNYIAPEILNKSKDGHDFSADLWSLGVIMFALLAGSPPFQSKTTEEMYARIRAKQYSWPDEPRHSIGLQARTLVGALLVEPDKRSSLDEVIRHEFFNLGWMPRVASLSWRYSTPRWSPGQLQDPLPPLVSGESKQNYDHACGAAGVGFNVDGKKRAFVGARRRLHVLEEIFEDEGASASRKPKPARPLRVPAELRGDRNPAQLHPEDRDDRNEELKKIISVATLVEWTDANLIDIEVKGKQSGDQHSRPRAPLRLMQASRTAEREKAGRGNLPEPRQIGLARSTTIASTAATARLQSDAIVTSRPRSAFLAAAVKSVDSVNHQGRSDRATSGQPTVRPPDLPALEPWPNAVANQSRQAVQFSRLPLATQGSEKSVTPSALLVDAEKRHASIPPRAGEASESDRGSLVQPARERCNTIIAASSNPRGHPLSRTNSSTGHEAYQSAHKLWSSIPKNLERLLEGLACSDETRTTWAIQDRPERANGIRLWVDYTQRSGLGYVLEDGTLGFLHNNGSCIVLYGSSLVNAWNFEASTHESLVHYFNSEAVSESEVEPNKARSAEVEVHRRGLLQLLSRSRDRMITDRHKKASVESSTGSEAMGSPARVKAHQKPMKIALKALENKHFITQYQRLGDVRVFVFSDRKIQINFPDHTKLMVDDDGRRCSLFGFPASVAYVLRRTDFRTRAQSDELRRRFWVQIRQRQDPHGAQAANCEDKVDHRENSSSGPAAMMTKANSLRSRLNWTISLTKQWCSSTGTLLADQPDVPIWAGKRLVEESQRWVRIGMAPR